VIAPSFGDIFVQNSVKNGLLTALVSDGDAAELAAAVVTDPRRNVTVDLEQKTIQCGNRTYNFSIDQVSCNQLLNGWDDIDLTESFRTQISAYRIADRVRRPWANPAKSSASSGKRKHPICGYPG
jgi:3-isopropylmalate/(R)-2-methylmalate dehydratase small subunit